ncbi:MAG: nucleoside triphosphate pyrophosphohydrolase [Lentisphaerae bacterium]|nr:nucleoside triphosphate pyrophosphohydrolase [Lentisphaerota bacterium]
MSDSHSDLYTPDAAGLLAVLRKLRSPSGCPWDRKQTRQSLVRHLDGECAELIDAIMRDDVPNIREELGDVLMNLMFQIVVAEEKDEFTAEDVWREIVAKMIRRHAHVFGDEHAGSAEEVVALWQKIKAAEKGKSAPPQSIMDEVKLTLCPLDRAEKMQKKAAEKNFDWQSVNGVVDKISEELDEVKAALASGDETHTDEEIGDLLFAVVNLIRFRKRHSAVEVMRRSNMKFEQRFRKLESYFNTSGKDIVAATPEELDAAWENIKQEGNCDHA